MPIQRQNPQFDPTRVVQPTAAPIDTYFRPMLKQAEPSSLIQVANALSSVSPQLSRLASDAMAANIAAQKEYGVYEATSEKDPEALRRKATAAIEESGGIAPWRYQAFLEAYGQRMVRDKYRNALWENLDDLSNPYNEDGTIRPQSYVSEKMSKLYDNAQIPADSYYINKGAAAARAEADNSFYERLLGERRAKVLNRSKETLQDGLQFSIESAHDVEALFGPNGALKALTDNYYKQGGTDGDAVLSDALVNSARGYVADGEYERARLLLSTALDGKIGDRAIGNRNRPRLQETLDLVEKKQREAELDDGRNLESRKQIALASVQDSLLIALQKKQVNTKFMNLDSTEVMDLVKQAAAGVNMGQDIKDAVQGRAVDWVRVQIEAINRPRTRDQRADSIAVNEAFKASRSMSSYEFEQHLTGLLDKEIIGANEAQQLRTANRQFNSLTEVDRQQMTARLNGLKGFSWSDLAEGQIALDGRAQIEAIGDQASSDVMSAFFAEINDPAFKQKYPNENEQMIARDRVLTRIIGEKKTELQAQYRSNIDRYNLTSSFDATVGPAFAKESDEFVSLALADLQITDPMTSTRLGSRLSAVLMNRLRDEWGSIAAPNGQPPYTLEQRRRELYSRIPDLKDALLMDMRTRPDSLGMPKDLVMSIRQQNQPPAPGVSEVSGKPAQTAAISAGDFKPESTLRRGPQYNATLPSEGELATVSSQAARFAVDAAANPSMRPRHDQAKAKASQLAGNFIAELQQQSAKDVQYGDLPPGLKSAPGPIPSLPLYELREDGVYELRNIGGDRGKSAVMTNRYWGAKSLIGYSPEELKSGKTSEGLNISRNERDASQYLYFQSAADFQKALDEYAASTGKKGLIAESYLELSGMTFEEFRKAQLNLIGLRKPLGQ